MQINHRYLHSPPPAHRGLTVWLPVNSRDDRCELLWRHPRPNRTHPQNQHQQCPACRHSHVHNRWEMFYRWMEWLSTHFTKVKTNGIIFFSLTLHSALFSHQVLWPSGWRTTQWCLAACCHWCCRLWGTQIFLCLLSPHSRKFVESASLTWRHMHPT